MTTDDSFFAALAADLQSEPDLRVTVQRAVGYVRALTRCDEVAVRLHVGGSAAPRAAATSSRGERLDGLRDEHGSAAADETVPDEIGGVVLVDDTAHDPSWPAWAAALAAEGVGSVLTVPLAARGSSLGLLSLYAAEAGSLRRWADDDSLELLVRQVAVALVDLRAAEDLETVREARTLVGQAQGILMERHDLDADQAFAVLRRYSQQGNVKLRDVAAQLVRTRRLPEGRPGR
ncbi:GAF and ANTAR domain-containing protein [Frigoribacterium sp. PhB116]|uniref:ANTAR domain-containing protein n=1 Tax=Frigoribacterium sp. PhB116 TaxID=2485174 RepID=UPI0010E73125|nr:GAF and ANTAR domain-containing protein [Frigoribacterium sp. PhB116]TDT63169.1 GAF domain-containing protein [Frigoribacterium sp. PhB116]